MADPFFSIIIPAYNRENFIGSAIESVLAQDFEDFELIIVDDASTDRTIERIETYSDTRIRLVRQPRNKERGAARNAGVLAARGQYICYLDSDDRFLPDHLGNFFFHIEKEQFPNKLWFSNTFLEKDRKRTEFVQPRWNEENKFGHLLRYTFNPCRVCISRRIALEIPFDETIPGIEDLDNWLRIAMKYPITQLNEYTSVYVHHETSYTSGDEKRFQKELSFFKKVFQKSELRGLLPQREKRYLLSKCHYHLAISCFNANQQLKTMLHSLKAVAFYPSGYNTNANKTMFVMLIYSIPLIGNLLRWSVRKIKRA